MVPMEESVHGWYGVARRYFLSLQVESCYVRGVFWVLPFYDLLPQPRCRLETRERVLSESGRCVTVAVSSKKAELGFARQG
jgi:hypothetical protein